ncbi:MULTISPECIES: GDYXXLXY domain-containing protein [Allobacillus]|uniref:GDYXXLXY domain-containing protein n=1 Tax=Allobacillus salarius TaxID=1955272 RepID=A0A556PMH3_9BACI|nr:GDYXXLXY domain-containing protein [Allobacillus salarius]TSJ65549.1 GDYXXLXY domain-containing protein [Allobacillus salarius]
MIRKKLLMILVGFQVLFLIGMVLSGYVIERVGDTITLQTKAEPYDYIVFEDEITLNFTAEEIRPENWFMSGEPESNQIIYVLLTPSEQGYYQVKAASDKKMDADKNEVIIKARYSYKDHEQNHIVRFGIDHYRTDTSKFAINSSYPRFNVEVALSPWGQSKVVDIEVID